MIKMGILKIIGYVFVGFIILMVSAGMLAYWTSTYVSVPTGRVVEKETTTTKITTTTQQPKETVTKKTSLNCERIGWLECAWEQYRGFYQAHSSELFGLDECMTDQQYVRGAKNQCYNYLAWKTGDSSYCENLYDMDMYSYVEDLPSMGITEAAKRRQQIDTTNTNEIKTCQAYARGEGSPNIKDYETYCQTHAGTPTCNALMEKNASMCIDMMKTSRYLSDWKMAVYCLTQMAVIEV
jgi:hypothetical protein